MNKLIIPTQDITVTPVMNVELGNTYEMKYTQNSGAGTDTAGNSGFLDVVSTTFTPLVSGQYTVSTEVTWQVAIPWKYYKGGEHGHSTVSKRDYAAGYQVVLYEQLQGGTNIVDTGAQSPSYYPGAYNSRKVKIDKAQAKVYTLPKITRSYTAKVPVTLILKCNVYKYNYSLSSGGMPQVAIYKVKFNISTT